MTEALELEVRTVRYRAPDGDFAILDGLGPGGDEIVLTGALGHLNAGETIHVEGVWKEHPRYGRQLAVAQLRVPEPSSERALLAYLSSIRHVSGRGAVELLQRHGPEVLEIIDRAPRARLLEVTGIGRGRVGAAVKSWEEQRRLRAVRLFLSEHGVPAAVAARITRALGSDSVEVLRNDPYRIVDLDGIGFLTADALARSLGLAPDDPARLDAGIQHALAEAELDGHCHLPAPELRERAGRLLAADVGEHVGELVERGVLWGEEGEDGVLLVALPSMHWVERRLATHVRMLIDAPPTLALERAERPTSGVFVPTDAQWLGVARALEHRLSILTGLPGTGKSATMRVLVDVLRAEKKRVRLCAPTGKAARRLSAATDQEASTIHRLLEWSPGEGFTRDAENPIEGCDMLIVDEASMLGVRLAESLLAAVGPGTHVLLVGDVDQLAPVGPGRVLEDLIASGRVPTTALSEIFRQAARSLIVRAAHAINRGEAPSTAVEGEDVVRDFFFLRRTVATEVFEEVVSLACDRLPAHYGLDPRMDVQVLAPMHRGEVGIDALNEALRARLNPDGDVVPGTFLRVGDRVIQTRNDHEHALMNGEVAVIEAVAQGFRSGDDEDDEDSGRSGGSGGSGVSAGPGGRMRVALATDDGRRLMLPFTALDTLRLGYAVSIHKAQGSQAPAVVIPLVRSHHVMLTRNLLYTAVTRAERVCVLVGEPAALRIALGRRDARRRHTRLTELVAGA